MPTDEATDLIELTREICRKDLAPQVDEAERAAHLPGGDLPHPRPRGPAVAALPRGVRRRRPALRGLPPGRRGDRLRLDERRRRRQRPQPHGIPRRDLRHARAEGGAAAGDALRRAARRLLPLRAARRVRHRVDDDPGDARTDDGWSLKGTKAWISHAGHADYYTTFARTSDDGRQGPVDLHRARRRRRAWPSPSPRRRWACTATPSRRYLRRRPGRPRPARRARRARA